MSSPKEFYQFPCGCKVPVISKKPLMMDLDVYHLPDCRLVYDLLARGETEGIFQISEKWVSHYCKLLKPENREQISILLSIIRPGCLGIKLEDKKSVTEHYIARKNKLEETIYLHPDLEPILKNTCGFQVFQEQSLRIAIDIAGFTPVEADLLRQAIGKKDAKLMESLKPKFLEGCLKTPHSPPFTQTLAEELFGQVEKSARYSFNKCISGRERIYGTEHNYARSFDLFFPTIEEMYKIKNDSAYALIERHAILYDKYNESGYGECFSLSETGDLVSNKIIGIYKVGKRPVYKVTLEDGKSIVVTNNHKFPTPDGEKALRNLRVNDLLYVKSYSNSSLQTTTSKIVFIEKLDPEVVYDVEVSGDVSHTFVTREGIVTSNSHSTGYGEVTYITAWLKTHTPLLFHSTMLSYAKEQSKKKEKRLERLSELIKSAARYKIKILPPTMGHLEPYFKMIESENTIRFGFCSMKNVGVSSFEKIVKGVEQGEREYERHHGVPLPVDQMSWYDILCYIAKPVTESIMKTLIRGGAFDYTNNPRMKMDNELSSFFLLSAKEMKWISSNCKDYSHVIDLLKGLLESGTGRSGGILNETRVYIVQTILETIKNTLSVDDDPTSVIMDFERDLLGIALTRTLLNGCNKSSANATVNDIEGENIPHAAIACQITNVRQYMQKNGLPMCFVEIADDNAESKNVLVFNRVYEQYAHLLMPQNTVMLYGEIENKSFKVNDIAQLT